MNRRFISLVLVLSMLGLSGCALFNNPFKSWQKAETKIAQVENKVATNQVATTKEGINYVYATKLALAADPATNNYHKVETELNDKAIVVLGTPSMEDITKLNKMVNDLLSTNAQIIIQGDKELAAMDKKVTQLQQENSTLEGTLSKVEAKATAIATANAGLAQKWATVTKFFWWIVYGIIFFTVVRIVTAVLPPPYNSLSIIVSLPVSIITKLIHALVPEAQKIAGLVPVAYQTATENLITSIKQIKTDHPELHNEISTTVAANANDSTASVINDTKTKLGMIS